MPRGRIIAGVILIIDNYDSFTYNLVQVVGKSARVVRNDEISLAEIRRMRPEKIILSPGPCTPDKAGICNDIVRMIRTPILGVCLGHQCIAQAFGGKIVHARRPMHGKTCAIRHDGKGLFQGLPSPFEAMCYNSLIVKEIPETLIVTARNPWGEIMGVRHRTLPIEGVQFHPESYRTPRGSKLLKNFLYADAPCLATT
jgi:anthranilate synthase/aminodeoxychorismate synthase-like glutamine amidotransferase